MNTHIRRPRASTVIASLALFVALGGSATAATLITGAKIKNGTVTGKDLKNSTLTGSKVKDGSLGAADLSTAARSSLTGPKGDTGATGPAGPAGSTGPQGPRGIVSPKVQTLGSKTIADGPGTTTILSNQLAAGTYVVTSKATLDAEDNDRVSCNLYNGAQSIDQTQWDAPSASVVSSPMALSAVVTITSGALSLQCSTDGTADAVAKDAKLIAMPVG